MLLKTQALRVASATAIFLISTGMATAGANDIAVIGPVDQVNCAAGTYRVLGVSFKANSKTTSVLCNSQNVAGVSYVVAAGKLNESGKVVGTELALVRSDMYVAGASVVFIRGPVSRVNQANGEFEVAGTRVVALTGQMPELGAQIDAIGTQPLLGSVLVADSVYQSSDSKTNSDSRIAKAIIGSGANKKAIIGSGSSTNAIIGSGSSSEAIIGSGASSSAIIGSGASTKAIIGSGSSRTAIIGSGSSSKAIIGSGSSQSAIIGSGATATAIIGSGAL